VQELLVAWKQAKLMLEVISFCFINSFLLFFIFIATYDYIRDDETFFPKVGVVTIAGLGGLLLGHKGGVLRKTFYSSVAVAVALSACYPKQSANLLDQVYNRIKNETQNLFDSKLYFNETLNFYI
jgi:hypothetical protein